jgi:hypothetical protein
MTCLPTALQYCPLTNSVLSTMPAALDNLARQPTPSVVSRTISHLPPRPRKDMALLSPKEWRGVLQH